METPIEGRKVLISEATKPQLAAFAKELGVSVTNFDKPETLIQKISDAGYEDNFIVVPDTAPAKPTKAAAASGGEVPEPTVSLTIHQQEGAGGKRAVFVGVNGKGILIPRNKPCTVKHRYLGALANATETKYEFDEDAGANVPREMPSYPYQVHTMPSEAAIEAYRKWYAANESRLAKEAA